MDSLVDAISFGFAPAMIMFFAVFNQDNWSWLLVFFLYYMCVHPAGPVQCGTGGTGQALLSRIAEPRGWVDTGDLLLVQPDSCCTSRLCDSRRSVERGSARAAHGATLAY